ncbi:MAG: hypothetical protein HZB84_09545 [Deltaproteobacteria bacterium]|nr:hypothetical protein [Deltaproteobacteria bacterium]
MKNVIIILIIFFAIRFLRKYLQPGPAKGGAGGAQGSNPRSTGQESEDMVQDHVCGSYIPISSAVTLHEDGRTEYFCGTECRDKYFKDR